MELLQGDARTRELLNQWMNERRQELRLRWGQVAQRAGMGTPNLLRIRKGQIAISWQAADGIEDALRWARGSVERAVLHGEQPTPNDPTASDSDRELLEDEIPEEAQRLYASIKAAFDLAGIPMTPRMLDVFHDEVAKQVKAKNAHDSDGSASTSESDPS